VLAKRFYLAAFAKYYAREGSLKFGRFVAVALFIVWEIDASEVCFDLLQSIEAEVK
jgi:hypothetical protein